MKHLTPILLLSLLPGTAPAQDASDFRDKALEAQRCVEVGREILRRFREAQFAGRPASEKDQRDQAEAFQRRLKLDKELTGLLEPHAGDLDALRKFHDAVPETCWLGRGLVLRRLAPLAAEKKHRESAPLLLDFLTRWIRVRDLGPTHAAALDALGKLGDKKATATLRGWIESEEFDVWMKSRLALALARLEDQDSLPWIREMANVAPEPGIKALLDPLVSDLVGHRVWKKGPPVLAFDPKPAVSIETLGPDDGSGGPYRFEPWGFGRYLQHDLQEIARTTQGATFLKPRVTHEAVGVVELDFGWDPKAPAPENILKDVLTALRARWYSGGADPNMLIEPGGAATAVPHQLLMVLKPATRKLQRARFWLRNTAAVDSDNLQAEGWLIVPGEKEERTLGQSRIHLRSGMTRSVDFFFDPGIAAAGTKVRVRVSWPDGAAEKVIDLK